MTPIVAARSEVSCVSIGPRPVGVGQPVYVVAEAGVNHNGSVDEALRLVEAAAGAGADAAKFQVFRADELASESAATAAYQRHSGGRSQREMLARLELTDDELGRVRAHCVQCGVEFLATPFGPRDVRRLLDLKVNAIKVASSDLNDTPLLQATARTGLPLVVSTGAATADEIETAVERLRRWDVGERLILLHCVSAYPTPLEAANLAAIGALRRRFGVPCGFSDHTADTRTGAWAAAAGACVLEKHITLDRAARGPDHAMSLDPSGMQRYTQAVRDAERALGTGALGMTTLQDEVRAVARKSIVAARDLAAGTRLRSEMLAIKRPGGGITPDQLDALAGRRITTDVSRDTALTWEMIE